MERITLKEMLSVAQQLPNRKLPSPVFKGEIIRSRFYAPAPVGDPICLKPGQIPVHFVQHNHNEERSDWIPSNPIVIVQDEIKSIQRNGDKLIITLV